jgi:hypothetical protein
MRLFVEDSIENSPYPPFKKGGEPMDILLKVPLS